MSTSLFFSIKSISADTVVHPFINGKNNKELNDYFKVFKPLDLDNEADEKY